MFTKDTAVKNLCKAFGMDYRDIAEVVITAGNVKFYGVNENLPPDYYGLVLDASYEVAKTLVGEDKAEIVQLG